MEPELLDEIKGSFNDLPETDHADGKYRLRKYSKVLVSRQVGWTESVTPLTNSKFTQSKEYNKHQGGMSRKFENIDLEVIKSNAVNQMVSEFFDICKIFEGKHQFDIHQMRVKSLGGATQLSPEGWHQDGYDYIAMIGVDRHNIIGGEVLLSTAKTEAPFLQATIDTGTLVIVNDSFLWHNGRSIQPIDDDEPAWMDVMVFTLKTNES